MAVSNWWHRHTRVLANNCEKSQASNTIPRPHRATGCSDLGDLTQARDLASFIVHCEEHGRGLRGMCLEELQGFIQGLWENLLSGQAWGQGAKLSTVQRVCRAQFSEHPLCPPLSERCWSQETVRGGEPKHKALPTLQL